MSSVFRAGPVAQLERIKMHWTVKRTFDTFVEYYCGNERNIRVLEIGSANFNGGLRDQKLSSMQWMGVDLSEGPGVDQVVGLGESLPFDAASFDLVVASSVFEHDIQFWNTFLEMSRVMKPGGYLLLIMPSQGAFHRYPLDAFRFYPDAGIALEKWAQSCNRSIRLVESFTTPPQIDLWADYIAIFTGKLELQPHRHIGGLLRGENWIVGNELIESTFQEFPFEFRRISELQESNAILVKQIEGVRDQLSELLSSKSWRLTKPFRFILSKFRIVKPSHK